MINLEIFRKKVAKDTSILVVKVISKVEGSSIDSSNFFFSLYEKYFRCKFLITFLNKRLRLKDKPSQLQGHYTAR
jgi:hypothetical protein